MPVITVEVGQLPKETKQELIEQLTTLSAEVTGIPEKYFIVSIHEQPDENVGVGGKTVAAIKQELGRK